MMRTPLPPSPGGARSPSVALSSVVTPVAPPCPQPAWRSMAAVATVAFALGLGMLGLQFARLGPDVTAPFFVGSSWKLHDRLAAEGMRVAVVPGKGYDGQWFLGLACDPFLTKGLTGAFDMPRYRAGRPLYAMAGWALAGGVHGLVPYALLAIGPLALALGAAATGRLLAAYGRSRWWGLAFAAVPGVVVGVTHATAEPLALALAALGLSLAAGSRAVAAGAAFAASALTKETYIAFAVVAAGVSLLAAWRRAAGWRAAALTILPGVALVAGWWAYVAVMVPASNRVKALDAVGPPAAGWVDTIRGMAAGTWVADAPVGPFDQALMLGSLVAALAGIVAGLRRPGLAGWVALALGCYALLLSGYLLDHFLSGMRALAPCVLAAFLGLATFSRRAAPASAGDAATVPASRPPGRSTPRRARPEHRDRVGDRLTGP